MKRMILAILLAATAQVSTAMPKTMNRKPATDENKTRSEQSVQDKKEAHMRALKHELALSDDKFEAFAPIYAEYRKALHVNKDGKHERFDFETASDAQVTEALNNVLDRKIHVATVRKAYIEKFGTVLTPRQICKLYKMNGKFHPAGKRGGKGGKQGHRGNPRGGNHPHPQGGHPAHGAHPAHPQGK